jgi:hypothetical protein
VRSDDKTPNTPPPGTFCRRDEQGRLHEVGPGPAPDVTICRRLADFPDGAPGSATVIACATCGALVATANRFPERPTICMQCAGIEPLPVRGRCPP